MTGHDMTHPSVLPVWLEASITYWSDADQASHFIDPPGDWARQYAKGQTDDPLEETYNISALTVNRIAELTVCGLIEWLRERDGGTP